MINPEPFLEEIQHQKKEHEQFLDNFGKQINKLKKQTVSSLQELSRAVQEEASLDYESEVTAFMKTVHMEVSGKLRGLEEQRRQT